MNGVQTRFKCKLDVKRCKRFVFPPSSLLPRSNALKTKAIRYFQTDRTLTRIVSPPLYTILSSESSDSTIWTIQIKLNPGHPVYQGHFPEHPVVPGVCLLQLIKECVEDIRQQKLQVTQVSSCKFLSAINPIETPHISVALTFKETEEGTLQLQAEGSVKKEAVKKSTVKESTVEENTVKDECFIKLKAALTPKA